MVRSWTILAALILVTLIVVAIQGMLQWRTSARMIENGVVVQAIGFADGARIKGRPLPIGQTVYVAYEYNGKKYESQGPLFRTGAEYIAGEPFPVRLDPDNPSVWSNRKQPISLRENMVGAIVTSVFAVLAMAVALFLHWRVGRLWRYGELRDGRVVDSSPQCAGPEIGRPLLRRSRGQARAPDDRIRAAVGRGPGCR